MKIYSSIHRCLLPVLAGLLVQVAFTSESAIGKKSVAITGIQSSVTKSPQSANIQNFKDGSEFIDLICQKANALNQYSYQYTVTAHKGSSQIQEKGTFYFKRPNLMRAEVTSGAKKGSLAIFAADGKVHGHLGGLLKIFNSSVSANSQYARTANGYPMSESDFNSLYVYLKNMLKQGDHSRVTKEPIAVNGLAQKVYVLEMYKAIAGKEQIIKRVFVDPENYLPVIWEDYSDNRLDTLSTWQNLNLNARLDDSMFKP